MTYHPRIATVSPREYAELMAIVREQDDTAPRNDDDRWRKAYAEQQHRLRIVGYQQDLFASTAITHYRRNAAAPPSQHRPIETIEAKMNRIRHDPSATFGPPRTDRPGIVPEPQRRAIVRGAANWLNVRQRVRLADAPGSVDPAFGIQRFLGRVGVIWRLCGSSFADHCYVFFDAVGSERTAKIQMVEVRDLEPLP